PSAPARYSKNRHALAAACRERRERRASECRCVPATPRTCSQSLLHPPARRRREAGGPSLTSAAGPRRVRKTAGGTQTSLLRTMCAQDARAHPGEPMNANTGFDVFSDSGPAERRRLACTNGNLEDLGLDFGTPEGRTCGLDG